MAPSGSRIADRAATTARTGRGTAAGDTDLTEALDCLLRFGALTLRSGNEAFRVREWMGAIARAMRVDGLAVHVTLGGMTATARRNGRHATLASEIAPIGVNAWRIGALEHLARTAEPGISPRAVAARLDTIEAAPPLYPLVSTARSEERRVGKECRP